MMWLILTTKSVTYAEGTDITGISVPPGLSYLLPQGYSGDIDANFIDTNTSDASINTLFASARNASFYAYDDEFYSIVGSATTTMQTIYASNTTFAYAHEAGVWLPDLHQLYFTGSGYNALYCVLDLDTLSVTQVTESQNSTLTIPSTFTGGDYFNSTVYLANFGLKYLSVEPAIYVIDPVSGDQSLVLNSYYGVPFNPIDDISWVRGTGADATSCIEDSLFFTTLDVSPNGETQYSEAVLPNAIFRYTPSRQSVQAVISRADILAPNGIYVDSSGSGRGNGSNSGGLNHLYVTDVSMLSLSGPGSNSSGSPAIYKFDLDADCNPVNKRLFALPRSGFADGIKVDAYGRVWTAEFEGIVVRDPRGKELGVFNAEQLVDTDSFPISQFGLAGDKLVVLAGDRIEIIQLAQHVTGPGAI
ncbi:hypothetical protein BX600DRAFT_516770 [Xylariales sp. PMI_506]|nr:hypothetical protein BX600DRAFT_516770 [Xylariales sp. PMI_506]